MSLEENREKLTQRLLVLSNEQIKDILEKYKYEDKVEVLPDILIYNAYYQYENGEYKKKEDSDKIIKGVMKTDNRILMLASDGLYRLNIPFSIGDRLYTTKIIVQCLYYKDNILIIRNKIGMNRSQLVALVYKDDELLKVDEYSNISDGTIGISQNDIIVTETKLLKFDTVKNKFIVIEEPLSEDITYTSIGRKNKILKSDGEKASLYDFDKQTNIPVNISRIDVILLDDTHIWCDYTVYRYTDDALIAVTSGVDISGYIASCLFYRHDYDLNTTEIIKSTDLLKTSTIIKIRDEDLDIFALPFEAGRLKFILNKYKKLIPMVNNNIKNLIAKFIFSRLM